MRTALLLGAFLLIASGGAAIVSGAPVMVMERGAALVVAGTVALSAGAILAGLAAVLAQLVRLEGTSFPDPDPARRRSPVPGREIMADATPPRRADPPLVDALSPADAADTHPAGPASPQPPPRPSADGPPSAEPHGAGNAAPAGEAGQERGEEPGQEPHAVGSYVSGSNAYVMYSDGSIEATLADGRRRFRSLADLKAFANGTAVPTAGDAAPAYSEPAPGADGSDAPASEPSAAAIAKP